MCCHQHKEVSMWCKRTMWQAPADRRLISLYYLAFLEHHSQKQSCLSVTHSRQAKSLGKPQCLCGELHKAVKRSLLLKYLEKSTLGFQSAGAASRCWGQGSPWEEQADGPSSALHPSPPPRSSWYPVHLAYERDLPPSLPSSSFHSVNSTYIQVLRYRAGRDEKEGMATVSISKGSAKTNKTTHKPVMVGKLNWASVATVNWKVLGLPEFSPRDDLPCTLDPNQNTLSGQEQLLMRVEISKKPPPFSEFRAPPGNSEVNIVMERLWFLPSTPRVELQAGLSHAAWRRGEINTETLCLTFPSMGPLGPLLRAQHACCASIPFSPSCSQPGRKEPNTPNFLPYPSIPRPLRARSCGWWVHVPCPSQAELPDLLQGLLHGLEAYVGQHPTLSFFFFFWLDTCIDTHFI